MSDGAIDAQALIATARECRRRGDRVGAFAAVDRALALEPRNLHALIARGDLMDESGDARGAATFYRTAIRVAPAAEKLPRDLRADIERAAARVARYGAQFESQLLRHLGARGWRRSTSSGRFDESLELLLGRKQVQLQRPRVYYFPGLPQLAFYDRERFAWLDAVEAATEEIRAELLEVLRDESAFKPYIEGNPRRPHYDQEGLLNNPAWSAFYLWKYGERIDANVARCPATARALEHVPFLRMQNRSPTALFSLLRPGAHIPPHNGMLNTRLICHLPLIVPGQCTFRVGNETREWVEGKAWVFDDTIEHEAWNRSPETRVILIFETWKPELSDEERALVCAMFEAVDEHSGERPDWEI